MLDLLAKHTNLLIKAPIAVVCAILLYWLTFSMDGQLDRVEIGLVQHVENSTLVNTRLINTLLRIERIQLADCINNTESNSVERARCFGLESNFDLVDR